MIRSILTIRSLSRGQNRSCTQLGDQNRFKNKKLDFVNFETPRNDKKETKLSPIAESRFDISSFSLAGSVSRTSVFSS